MDNRIIQLNKLLIRKKQKIAVAESLTGGQLSSLLTQTPNSSKYFILGLVTYTNQAKTSLLNIPAKLIRQKGAVSQEVALIMAHNVRILARCNIGIGITGIAGPAGAVTGKPVGTVFISLSTKNKQICQKFLFKGNRSNIRKQAALKAIQLLLNQIPTA